MDAITLLSTRASAPKLTDPAPDDEELRAIVEAALRAPDHGALRPWKIVALRGDARNQLGEHFARIALEKDPNADAEVIARAKRKPLRAPLLLVVLALVREHKIPKVEQILSAGSVAHGILLGLDARGFAGMWRTGAVAYDPQVIREYTDHPDAEIVGFLYCGTRAGAPPDMRRPSIDEHFESRGTTA